MVLVDTSVWIQHFRKNENQLSELLIRDLVLIHPFVIGELACGRFKERQVILRDLSTLPSAPCATHHETLRLLEEQTLWGEGIGWIDAHLIASALLASCSVWTFDERLGRACRTARVRLQA